jgi:hypothetical protein
MIELSLMIHSITAQDLEQYGTIRSLDPQTFSPIYSWFNHTCDEKDIHWGENYMESDCEIRFAARNIKAGDEVCTKYLPLK